MPKCLHILKITCKPSTFSPITKPALRTRLHSESRQPPNNHLSRFTFPSLLKTFTFDSDLNNGEKVHARILTTGLHFDTHIASALISLYAKCGSLSSAAKVFDELPERDPTVWNAMLSGYFCHGRKHDALSLLSRMQSLNVKPDRHCVTIVLAACSNGCLALEHGREVHGYVLGNGYIGDPFLDTALVDMYAKSGEVMEAYKVFQGAVRKEVLVWNAMISGFCRNGMWEKSLELFACLWNGGGVLHEATFVSVLMICSIGEAVVFGECIHCCLMKMGCDFDPYVCTSLLAMYAKCGLVEAASMVFQYMPNKGTELWNSLISAYLNNTRACEALHVYKQMKLMGVRLDSVTIVNVLSACSVVGLFSFGKVVHGELIKMPVSANMIVQSSLMTMYMKNGDPEDADVLFSSSEEWDVVVWSSMIAGFCQNMMFTRAFGLFNQLRARGLRPDSVVISTVASATSTLGCLELGCQLHGYSIKSSSITDVFVGSSLIDMYSKCGLPQASERVFSNMVYKNLVVYNSMISCYSRNGLVDDSIRTFVQISQHGLVPDSISITSILASVSSVAALAKGKMIHGYQIRTGVPSDLHVENALLNTYMKCGCLIYAQQIFNRMPLKDAVAWNTMISGYGSHGHCLQAIRLFEEMQALKVSPDDSTFLSLISSCSHSGLVEQGIRVFDTMIRKYGIRPSMEHYANIVDLLGRAGQLDEANGIIENMPIEANESVLLCLLSACRANCNTSLAELVADSLLKLKPEGSGSYTQLLNFYNEVGSVEKAANLRLQMKQNRTKKVPGCSWIELQDQVEVFYSGYSSSSLTLHIHDTLKSLRRIMRQDDKL